MHCCVLGSLSCSLFLHMSFELKLLLLLLWLAASCTLFLHSHAWLSDCLVARLCLGPLDSRYAWPSGTGGWNRPELSSILCPRPSTGQSGREAVALGAGGGYCEGAGQGTALICGLCRPGVLKEPKLMGTMSFFIFFFTLLVLARQVSHPAQPSRASYEG